MLLPPRIWQGLEPDLRQAAGEILQAKEEFQAVGKEVEGLWSDVQRALSGSDTDGAAQGNVDLEWEGLKRDASKVAKEVLGEVSNGMTDLTTAWVVARWD